MSKSQRGASCYRMGKYLSSAARVLGDFYSEMPRVEPSTPVRNGRRMQSAPARTWSLQTSTDPYRPLQTPTDPLYSQKTFHRTDHSICLITLR
jgi:hypothetical protein